MVERHPIVASSTVITHPLPYTGGPVVVATTASQVERKAMYHKTKRAMSLDSLLRGRPSQVQLALERTVAGGSVEFWRLGTGSSTVPLVTDKHTAASWHPHWIAFDAFQHEETTSSTPCSATLGFARVLTDCRRPRAKADCNGFVFIGQPGRYYVGWGSRQIGCPGG